MVRLLAQSSDCCGQRTVMHLCIRRRPQSSSGRHTINVLTLDGETFPVKRKLLRSCIALTSELRGESEEPPTVSLDVDTLTFDRSPPLPIVNDPPEHTACTAAGNGSVGVHRCLHSLPQELARMPPSWHYGPCNFPLHVHSD